MVEKLITIGDKLICKFSNYYPKKTHKCAEKIAFEKSLGVYLGLTTRSPIFLAILCLSL
jgi:hypothetical protein